MQRVIGVGFLGNRLLTGYVVRKPVLLDLLDRGARVILANGSVVSYLLVRQVLLVASVLLGIGGLRLLAVLLLHLRLLTVHFLRLCIVFSGHVRILLQGSLRSSVA